MDKYKLQLTNGYYLKFTDVSRLLKYIYENKDKKSFFSKEFISNLGITENHFESLSAFSIALGLINGKIFTLTELGLFISKYDIYFDKEDTLFILHYNISSIQRNVVWNRLINRIMQENSDINTEIALSYYKDLSSYYSEKTIKNKLPKELLSAFFSYGEQNFTNLNILEKIGTGKYKIKDSKICPSQSFMYSLLHFRDMYFTGSTALLINDIISMENSPGKIMFLDKYKTNDLLEKLHSKGDIRIETVGDLNQIRFSSEITKEKILKNIYEVS